MRAKRAAVLAVSAAVVAAAIAAAILWWGRGPERATGRAACADCNVFVLVLDALRPDHLGCYGGPGGVSPEIDALAASAIRFERMIAASPWTKSSVAAILTGALPRDHAFYDLRSRLPDEALTLPEILAGAGYDTAAFVGNRVISEKTNVVQGFRTVRFPTAKGEPKPESRAITDAVLKHLSRARPDRNFVYVHYMDTHEPYSAPKERGGQPPGGGGAAKGPGGFGRLVGPGGLGLRKYRGSTGGYDRAIRINDAQVGRLLRGIRDRGMWDRSIVVVMADHGEAFGEHGHHGHFNSLYDEELRVPFILRVPGGAARAASGIASHVDVLPTLLALLGLPAPDGIDGVDALAGGREIAVSEFRKDGAGFTSARTRDRKVIYDWTAKRYSCFDLAADPGEARDLFGSGDPRCLELRGAVERRLAALGPTGKIGTFELGEGELQQLRALGYVDRDAGADAGR